MSFNLIITFFSVRSIQQSLNGFKVILYCNLYLCMEEERHVVFRKPEW
jgi:hypothetical protein